MLRCIELGRQSMAKGNAPVGSVIVRDGEIIGEGLELGKTQNDITYHAEIEAIRDALKKGAFTKLSGTTLYTTHEPCLMCSYAIRHYEIKKVVYGLSVKDIGGHTSDFAVLKTTGVSNWPVIPEIISGFMEAECHALQNELKTKKNNKRNDRSDTPL